MQKDTNTLTQSPSTATELEKYFQPFRENIIGVDTYFKSPYKEKQRIIYADWTASGRIYGPIEDLLLKEVYPYTANTHTETSVTGRAMTLAYHKALSNIKAHVQAGPKDVIISSYSGMTGVVNKFQRILGLRIHEKWKGKVEISEADRPVVFVTHMEHHSNQTSWLETICDVEIINPNSEGLVDLNNFSALLQKYENRKMKIASVTASSNVTGIFTPFYEMAEMIHDAGGYCFVDFACCAPYVDINMHPKNPKQKLDAIFFSPHKFLGGPGSTGILIFDRSLYQNTVPDNPGGGTVLWTNPWGEHHYFEDIETREDGGTPAFLQTIKAGLCVKLKDEMDTSKIHDREKEQLDILWDKLTNIPNLHILAENVKVRLPIISFYIDNLHYNLGVKLLNDRFGIQVRGGCSCAGTYGHYLLHVEQEFSNKITSLIDQGDFSEKPGWIRMSIHHTMTNEEVTYICDSIIDLARNFETWSADYVVDYKNNTFQCKDAAQDVFIEDHVTEWFERKLC